MKKKLPKRRWAALSEKQIVDVVAMLHEEIQFYAADGSKSNNLATPHTTRRREGGGGSVGSGEAANGKALAI